MCLSMDPKTATEGVLRSRCTENNDTNTLREEILAGRNFGGWQK